MVLLLLDLIEYEVNQLVDVSMHFVHIKKSAKVKLQYIFKKPT